MPKKSDPTALPAQYRVLTIDPAEIETRAEEGDENGRVLTFPCSSEIEALRSYGIEILDHKPKSVRMERMKDASPLLLRHNGDQQIGVVEKAWLKEKRMYVTVRFSQSSFASEILRDVKDGIRRHVSIGYIVHHMQMIDAKDDMRKYRAVDWEPFEVSIVPVPVDPTVGIGRAQEGEQLYPVKVDGVATRENHNMAEPTEAAPAASPAPAATPSVSVQNEVNQAREMETARIREITAIGATFKQSERAMEAIGKGVSVDQFRAQVLDALKAKPVVTASPEIGMSDKEARQFSVVRAMSLLANGKPLDGIEAEASRAVAQKIGREPQGFFIPADVRKQAVRGLNALVGADGAFTIGTDVLAGSMIEILDNRMLVPMLGAIRLTGLVGNIAIPKQTGGATAYWLPESGEAPDSKQAFGQVALTPHRLVGRTAYTKQLLAQSSIDVESFVRGDIATRIALARDLSVFNGSGADGEPLGILNLPAAQKATAVTFGAAATRLKAIEFQTNVAAVNASRGSLAYVTSPTVAGKWMGITEAANTASWLWKGNIDTGEVVGRKAESSNQIPGNKVIYGNWADAVLADWEGMDVVLNPYTLDASGQVLVTVTVLVDNGFRHGKSFCHSTDSGAQ